MKESITKQLKKVATYTTIMNITIYIWLATSQYLWGETIVGITITIGLTLNIWIFVQLERKNKIIEEKIKRDEQNGNN